MPRTKKKQAERVGRPAGSASEVPQPEPTAPPQVASQPSKAAPQHTSINHDVISSIGSPEKMRPSSIDHDVISRIDHDAILAGQPVTEAKQAPPQVAASQPQEAVRPGEPQFKAPDKTLEALAEVNRFRRNVCGGAI